jgi:tetratricopeptide (TPR) repeat protein
MAHNTEVPTSTDAPTPLARLPELEKRVLSYAAAMGKEFDFSVLALATEMAEEPLAESLERLVHMGILKELKGGDSYTFDRMETLAQAYRDISSSRLRVMHKKIAEAYEKLFPDPVPDLVPEMGRHFYLGRVHDKSLLYNRYAATIAMNAFSPDVAIRYLERAREDLAAMPGDHKLEEADILKDIGEQYSVMGEDTKADEFYAESLKKVPEGDVTLRALLLLSRADAAREMDNLERTIQYCEEAIKFLEKVGHRKGLAMAHRSLGRVAFKRGDVEVGKREIETTLGYLDPKTDAKEIARLYIEFGNVHSIMPDPVAQEKALDYYRKAIRALEPINDYHELGRAHNNLAIAMGTAHAHEALVELRKALEFAVKGKDRRFQGWALFNTVYLLLYIGDQKQAAENNEQAHEILSKLNDPMALEQVALNDGMLAQAKKSYEDSERAYLGAMKKAEKLGYPPVLVEVHYYLATMYSEWGKKEEAVKEITKIKELGESHVSPASLSDYEKLKQKLDI